MNAATKEEMADAVTALAEANYATGHGWQVFVECYSRQEMLEFVADCDSLEYAISLATKVADIRTERCEDARAEIF